MRYDPSQHHRQSTRLRGYDYTQSGAYFVTLVTQGRVLLFDDPMLRRLVETMWQEIPRHHPRVTLDAWVVMPNHLHGILFLEGPDGGQPAGAAASGSGPPPASLGAIVGSFKAVTTRRINRVRGTPGARVWQRNYHERVIRNERELAAMREYVVNNPLSWELDAEYPGR